MIKIRNIYAGVVILLCLSIVGCGRKPQGGVYIDKVIMDDGMGCYIGYIILDGRIYEQSGAETDRNPKELIGDFIGDIDGKKIVTNSFVGAKLYSVKGYNQRDRVICIYENDLDSYQILDGCDKEYIYTLQDIYDKFHFEPENERLKKLLEVVSDSPCVEYDRGKNPCSTPMEPSYYTVQQKGKISDDILVYPNGYLCVPIVDKKDKVVYFKVSEEIMKEFPDFFKG